MAKQEYTYYVKICNLLSIEKLWINWEIKELNSDFKELEKIKDELKKEKDRLEEKVKKLDDELKYKEGQQKHKKKIYEEELRKNKEKRGQKPRE